MPVPFLERLDLCKVSISRDTVVFKGVHPVLSDVRLCAVTLPNDLGFLKNLRELHLNMVKGYSGTLPISKLYQILAGSPNLEQLELDADYIDDMLHPPPILFIHLASFSLASSKRGLGCPITIITMIHAPNVTHLDVDFHLSRIPAGLNIFSAVTVQQLRQASHLTIEMSSTTFKLSTGTDGVTIKLSSWVDIMEHPARLLRRTNRIIPPSAHVDVLIDHSRHSMVVFDYLKSIRRAGYPFPELRKVHLIVFGWSNFPYKDLVADLARARPKIAEIIVQLPPYYGSKEEFFRWDAESSSLVLIE
ncbi:hypothetical protein FRC01_011466 [Tulasnella sp. 417]|nr:hypothetical protein FRC01_011466 [Tulasnella sp. 417]